MPMSLGWWSATLMRRCGNLNIFQVLEDLKLKWLDLEVCYHTVIFMTWGSGANLGFMINKQQGARNVRARIDRGVASPCWMDMFKEATVTHITTSRSDHFPLLLCYSVQPLSKRGRRPFRYEHMWERDTTLYEEVRKAWHKVDTGGPSLANVACKLNSVGKSLQVWSKN